MDILVPLVAALYALRVLVVFRSPTLVAQGKQLCRPPERLSHSASLIGETPSAHVWLT